MAFHSLIKTKDYLQFTFCQGDRAQPVLWGIHTVREVHGKHGGGRAYWRRPQPTSDVCDFHRFLLIRHSALRRVQKEEFKQATNNRVEMEEMVECEDCGRKLHQVCVLHLQNISGSKFHCSNCTSADAKTAHRFTAKNLPTTRLSNFIEVRVENFLKRVTSAVEKVHVRVVFERRSWR